MNPQELFKHLHIEDPLDQSTCIGYTQRGRMCRNPVAHSSRSQASFILAEVAKSSEPRAMKFELVDAASLLLCKRNHQWQTSEKVVQWRHNLGNISPTQPQRYTSPSYQYALPRPSARSSQLLMSDSAQVSNTTTRRTQTSSPSTETTVRTVTNEDLLLELLNRVIEGKVDSQQISRALQVSHSSTSGSAIARTASPARPVTGDIVSISTQSDSTASPSSRESETSQSLPVSTPVTPASENVERTQTPTPAPQSVRTTTPTNESTSSNRPSTDALRQARVAALNRAHPAPAPAPAPAPRRQTHVECGICLEPYDFAHGEAYWQCDSCENRTHTECFDEWYASRSRDDAGVTCPHCRAEV